MELDATSVGGRAFPRFVASTYGRSARIGLGLSIVGAGLLAVPWPWGVAFAAVGLLPLATGVFNLCPLAPLWGGHFLGARYCAASRSVRGPASSTDGGQRRR